jgi:hypothetical protein
MDRVMAFAQRKLHSSPQADLFGDDAPAGPAPYQVKPEHVLNRLVEMLDEMRGAAAWPWDETRMELYRKIVWPRLLRLLPADEADRWRSDLEAEADRLDLS